MSTQEYLKEAMDWLGSQTNTIFLGQNILFPENKMYRSLLDIPDNKKIEMPVCEDLQMGLSIGLALQEFIPITIYPRFDFLLLAANQLVNHLDKRIHIMNNLPDVRIIIRTMVGKRKPLNPGSQHTQNHTTAFRLMLPSIHVVELYNKQNIMKTYQDAYNNYKSTLVVENL